MEHAEDVWEVNKLKFKAADSNGDGVLHDHDELAGFFYPETNDAVLAVIVAERLKHKDANGDGRLSFDEFFKRGVDDEKKPVSTHEEAEFTMRDMDGNDQLDFEELKRLEA